MTCGGGSRLKKRICMGSRNGGEKCPGPFEVEEPCAAELCPDDSKGTK